MTAKFVKWIPRPLPPSQALGLMGLLGLLKMRRVPHFSPRATRPRQRNITASPPWVAEDYKKTTGHIYVKHFSSWHHPPSALTTALMTSDSSVGLVNLPATDPERIWRQLPSTAGRFSLCSSCLLGQGCARPLIWTALMAIALGGTNPTLHNVYQNNAEVTESHGETS